jgi:hypothetical protein
MDQSERQTAIKNLLLEINGKLNAYDDCLKSDAIFEIKKN